MQKFKNFTHSGHALGNRSFARVSLHQPGITYVYRRYTSYELDPYTYTYIDIELFLCIYIRTFINMGIILFGCLDAEQHFSCTPFGLESQIDTLSSEKRSIIISLYVARYPYSAKARRPRHENAVHTQNRTSEIHTE